MTAASRMSRVHRVTPYVQIFFRIVEESFKIGPNILISYCLPAGLPESYENDRLYERVETREQDIAAFRYMTK